MEDRSVTIKLNGRIDSDNAEEVEREIIAQLPKDENCEVIFDAHDLQYISSAGLRTILRIRKSFPNIRVTGVRSEVYEVFDMT